MDRSKDVVAESLAQAHYTIEPGIRLIVRLVEQDEEDQSKPIKLLEVNENTTADGIRPVFFGSDAPSGIAYPSVIIEVTPEEYEDIKKEPSRLPNGWRIGREIQRTAATKAG